MTPGTSTATWNNTLPKTAARSAQLIAASERSTLDPFVEVDWNLPLDDDQYYLPQRCLPLYGTDLWEAMDEPARIEYSRHECAAMYGTGIYFENQLMQIVLRHLVDLPVTSPAHRYLLLEVADECRHSTMFGEFIRRAGTPAYAPPARVEELDALRDVPGGRALGYLLILAVEELLDATNRATMRDEQVHQISRQIAKVHVLEEARHVSFAKTYLTEVWPTLSADERDAVRYLAPTTVADVASLMIDPAVYESLGLDGGEHAARSNPYHRDFVVDGLAKLVAFLTRLGVIDDDTQHIWDELRLTTNSSASTSTA
jgi:hypothetical protein